MYIGGSGVLKRMEGLVEPKTELYWRLKGIHQSTGKIHVQG